MLDTERIYVKDYGIEPDSKKDCSLEIASIMDDISKKKTPVVLVFDKGQYDFTVENSKKVPYFISNTASEQENPDTTKNIAIHIKDISNLTIEGTNTFFLLHGRIIPFVIDNCENIIIRNIDLDYERATMSEMKVEFIGENYIDFAINKDSWYSIKRNRLIWEEDGFTYTSGPSQEYDPNLNITWRTWNPAYDAKYVQEMEPGRVRFYYDTVHETKVGNIFQMRDGLRDQVGTFITKSKNISFTNLGFHYMHGLGIIAQFSENLNFEKLDCSPRPITKRVIASAADFMHFSGCKGKISICNSKFIGAHDDPINIHGTYLKIVKIHNSKQVTVRFMHAQTYGFDAFFPEDEIEFIDPVNLITIAKSKVLSTQRLNNRDFKIEFEEISEVIQEGDVIENVNYTATVEIIGNYFGVVSTRGILVTTRNKVLIENNYFDGMQMSGILISNDANGWYESGKVNDVTICNNTFNLCADPVICIAPENRSVNPDKPVHKNIKIKRNTFILSDARMLDAKSTKGILVIDNIINQNGETCKPLLTFNACSDVEIRDNCINNPNNIVFVENCKQGSVIFSENQKLELVEVNNYHDYQPINE